MTPEPEIPTTARAILSDVAAFVLAASCAGCDRVGVLLCADCRAMLRSRPVDVVTPRGLPVHAAVPFDGVAARCIRRLKGDGETLLARPLGGTLAAVLRAVLDTAQADHLVPVPTARSAFRRRGYRVPDLLLRRAGRRPSRLLRASVRRADQRGLTVSERAENVHGTLRVLRRGNGLRVVIVDDVVTTGATIDEAARALTAAGYVVVCGVVLAATPSHRTLIADSSTTRSK